MRIFNRLKWIYILILYILVVISGESTSGFIYENKILLLVLIIIFVVYMKFISIPQYIRRYGLSEYFQDIVESLFFFMAVGLFVSFVLKSIYSSVLFEVFLFLFIGYGDYFIAKYYYKKEYNFDRLNMYSILALVYLIGEAGLYTVGNFTSIRNAISFIVFMDIFVSLIVKRFIIDRNKSKRGKVRLAKHDLYMPLSPKEDIEKSTYFEMLSYGLREKNIKNIAITSIYGGGKSSVINSFLNNYKHPSEIKVSLANFEKIDIPPINQGNGDSTSDEGKSQDNSVINKNKIKEDALQLKIIKHLFYKVNPHRLPKSVYVKSSTSPRKIGGTLLFFYMVYLIVVFLNQYFFRSFFIISDDNALIHFIPLLTCVIYLLLCESGLKLKNVDTKIGKFEVGKDETIGTFDKYIDEIIYFFSTTGYRLVIIEDVDRYNSIHIFNSLRELNILLNDCETISEKVTFVYALNDYLLEEENIRNNKSKFFDLVIPIIPISSKYNSAGIIIEYFQDIKINLIDMEQTVHKEVSITPSEEFIIGLSAYVYDMRTIKNIHNEYIATILEFSSSQGINIKNVLSKEYLDKLYAMIVYKNYMPLDFSDLYEGKGILYNLFKYKSIFFKKNLDIVDDEINKYEKYSEYLRSYSLGNAKYEKLIYDLFKAEYGNINLYIYDTNNTYNRKTINLSKYSNIREQLKGLKYKVNNNNPIIDFDDKLESLLTGGSEWFSLTSKNRSEVSLELYNLRKRKAQIKYRPLSELLTDLSSEVIKEEYFKKFEDIEKKKGNIINDKYKIINRIPEILIYLLKSKKLSEDYASYMNFHKEGRISNEDRLFIQSLYSKQEISRDTVLQGFKSIIPLLDITKISNKNLLNYSFIDYLIKVNDLELLQSIFDEHNHIELSDFFGDYFGATSSVQKVIHYLINNQKELLNMLFIDFSNDDYLTDILINGILEYNLNLNICDILDSKSIESINSFSRILLYHTSLTEDRVINYNNNLLLINVKLRSLDNSTDNNKLLKYIELHRLFQININMLNIIINGGFNNIVDLNYTNIRKNTKNILEYIQENINEFVESVLLKLNSVTESSEAMITIINDLNLERENKIKVIESDSILFRIEKISQITDNTFLIPLLLSLRIDFSIDNVTSLYKVIKSSEDEEVLNAYLDFLCAVIDDESIEYSNLDEYIIKMLSLESVNYSKLNRFLQRTIYSIDLITVQNNKTISKLLTNNIVTIETLYNEVDIVDMLEIIYLSSIVQEKIDFTLFDILIDNYDCLTEFSSFVCSMKDIKTQKCLIEKYYKILDQKLLFSLLPIDIRNDLVNKKHPFINENNDKYWMVEIGIKLKWFSKTNKDDNIIRLNPKSSKINMLI
ncbi:hypothetical protein ACAG96_07150 [Candidatus Izemoplasma sp. B36]|uniref:YobI family P-loop NTPase n=1 Tax=Candidatus Izemoplasma sp. B36 TaxID=3242468 RepID=UPI00355873A7